MREELERKRVLVVDDDRDFVETLELYLRYAGYDVSCAYGGMGALEEMRIVNPHAVILDVMMPDIDGRQVIRHIREKMRLYDTPVIVLSSLCDHGSRLELLMEGANEFLTKPCEPEEVFRTVEELTTPQVGSFLEHFMS